MHTYVFLTNHTVRLQARKRVATSLGSVYTKEKQKLTNTIGEIMARFQK